MKTPAKQPTLDELAAQVAALTEKNAKLEARLAQLEPEVEPLKCKTAEVEREAISYEIPPDLPRTFKVPTQGELRDLLTIVLKHHPELRPEDDELARFFREFWYAFFALATMARTPGPDFSRYPIAFADEARDRIKRMCGGFGCGFAFPAFFAALLAHGDISYTEGPKELGLHLYDIGMRATDAWNTVLKTKEIKEPTPQPPLRQPTLPHPATISREIW